MALLSIASWVISKLFGTATPLPLYVAAGGVIEITIHSVLLVVPKNFNQSVGITGTHCTYISLMPM